MKIVEYGEATGQAGRVTIFLHGFPGLKSKQNTEIAESVAARTGRRVLVVLYGGLSKAPGTFDFPTCREEVLAWFESRLNEWSEVSLVGHSWGGFLSLSIAARWPEKIKQIVLMSPLLKFAGPHLAEPAFAQTLRDHPELSMVSARELAISFDKIGRDFDTTELASKVGAETRVLLLQARTDAITPPEHAEALVARFQTAPRFEFVENDHSFLSNRSELAQRISAFLTEA